MFCAPSDSSAHGMHARAPRTPMCHGPTGPRQERRSWSATTKSISRARGVWKSKRITSAQLRKSTPGARWHATT